jgi:hypothetical protein
VLGIIPARGRQLLALHAGMSESFSPRKICAIVAGFASEKNEFELTHCLAGLAKKMASNSKNLADKLTGWKK